MGVGYQVNDTNIVFQCFRTTYAPDARADVCWNNAAKKGSFVQLGVVGFKVSKRLLTLLYFFQPHSLSLNS